jgi:hypothetical protein
MVPDKMNLKFDTVKLQFHSNLKRIARDRQEFGSGTLCLIHHLRESLHKYNSERLMCTEL